MSNLTITLFDFDILYFQTRILIEKINDIKIGGMYYFRSLLVQKAFYLSGLKTHRYLSHPMAIIAREDKNTGIF